jgi:hypothetical protein
MYLNRDCQVAVIGPKASLTRQDFASSGKSSVKTYHIGGLRRLSSKSQRNGYNYSNTITLRRALPPTKVVIASLI